MLHLRHTIIFCITAVLLFSKSLAYSADNEAFVNFESAELSKGRVIWLENCKTCHAYGIAGAPIPMNPEEWSHRVVKNKATLYAHAINGFFGKDDTMMPERGGNPDLTDTQVKLAVDYMVSLATFYINQNH